MPQASWLIHVSSDVGPHNEIACFGFASDVAIVSVGVDHLTYFNRPQACKSIHRLRSCLVS